MNVLHGNYALLLLQLRGKCCYRHFVDSDIVWLLHSVPPYPKTICFFLSVSVWLWVILLCSHSVQSLSCVWLFATPWTAACQASLSITNSWSPRKPMSIESVMPSNYLILCRPLFLLPSIFPSIRVFSNESSPRIRWQKYWSFSFNISPSNEHTGLIFRMDWLDLLAVSNTTVSKYQFFCAQLYL